MADYNIYIHAIGTGGATNQNPTVPWSQKDEGGAFSQTTPQSGSGLGVDGVNVAFAISRASNFAQNPDAIVGTAVSGIAKIFPWIAVAFAVTKLVDTAYTTALDFTTLETGDYRAQIQWDNFKTVGNDIFKPVSTLLSSLKTRNQWRIENYKQKAQRDLLGDSVINSYTNRGV